MIKQSPTAVSARHFLARSHPLGLRAVRVLDRAEQVAAFMLFAWLVWRLLPGDLSVLQSYTVMLLLSEGTVLAFLLARRPTTDLSTRPVDWFLGFSGTVFPLLIVNSGEPFWPTAGSMIVTVGFGIHLWAKLTLRRSFGLVAADRGIKVVGPYFIVRHPMYLGYIVSHIGFLIAVPSVWNGILYALAWSLLLARIAAEERLLRQNVQYQAYVAKVPWRLVPFLW